MLYVLTQSEKCHSNLPQKTEQFGCLEGMLVCKQQMMLCMESFSESPTQQKEQMRGKKRDV